MAISGNVLIYCLSVVLITVFPFSSTSLVVVCLMLTTSVSCCVLLTEITFFSPFESMIVTL